MSTPLVTLDSKGIIKDPAQKVEWILTYLLITEASQSNVHRNSIISIPDILRKYGQDRLGIKDAIEESLETAFEGYFDSVVVDVSVQPTPRVAHGWTVHIAAKVQQENTWHDIANTLTATNDKVQLVSELDIK